MFSLRSPIILGAAPLGLVLAALAFLIFGASASVGPKLDRLQARIEATRPPEPVSSVAANDAVATSLSAPLFALTTGPGAVADTTVRLDGLAISPRGKSALLAVDGKPAAWIALGTSSNGVTLMDVQPNKVVVDTAIGLKDVTLGVASPAGAGAATTGRPPPQPPLAPR